MTGWCSIHSVARPAAAVAATISVRRAGRLSVSTQVRKRSDEGSSKKKVVCLAPLAEEAMISLRQPGPPPFRKALLEAFKKEIQSFHPDVHKGDRQLLVERLRNCRLGKDARSFNLEAKQAQQVTKAYVQKLWTLAADKGLAVDSDGVKMRSAAAHLARCFLEEATEPQETITENLSPETAGWKALATWLSERALEREPGSQLKADDFHEDVSPFWRKQLERVNRPEALRLVHQLGGDNLFGWLRSMAGGRSTGLFDKALRWKANMPDYVLLVQVGDFFEAWGVDAVMLVQWCGLNPMARRARAGFPVNAASLQQTIDSLTRVELSVAVYVQSAENKTKRILRQVLTPGAPTYLYGHELGKEQAGDFSEGRPYIAMRLRTNGLLFAEIRPFRREVCFREDVTPEAVEALLADHDGVAWPVFVDGSTTQVKKWKWFPKERRWMNLPTEVRDDYFLNRCCQDLCQLLQLSQDPPFVHVRLDTDDGALQPLTLSTAKNLGVLHQSGVPLLVAHALPQETPVAARRLMRRWLLAPRSEECVHAMRLMLKAFISNEAMILPSLQRVPPVAKVVAYITAQTANERLFRDIKDCMEGLQTFLQNDRYSALWDPLLSIAAIETGLDNLDRQKFLSEIVRVLALFEMRLQDPSQPDDPAANCSISRDADTQRAVERLFESNEAFRGIASQQQESISKAYRGLNAARDDLCKALQEGLPSTHTDMLVYNPFDNDICFKKKPLGGDCHGAHDRRGKAKKERFTTKKLEGALQRYLMEAKRTEQATQAVLVQLCGELSGHVAALRTAVTAAELLITAHAHASHAFRCGWTLPRISGQTLEATIAPYWMDSGDAVFSHVVLEPHGAIATGPNMSGKSTLMRAIGACSLLANCGFLCPCKSNATVPRYRQVVWVAAEGDRPAEGVSAFGQEAMISAALLRRAEPGTLALVDEFGRGTEPRAAKAAVCALIEELAARGTQFVVATHLHAILNAKLRLDGPAPVPWRMGMRQEAGYVSWTYQLEMGICRDSLAAQTLEHFGWTKSALQRFHELIEVQDNDSDGAADYRLESAENALDADIKTTCQEPTDEKKASKARDPEEVVLAMMSSLLSTDAQVVRLCPTEAPPAPLCAGAAVLYALCLSGQMLYIGQSDHFRQRMRQHRQRFGRRLESVLLLPVANTAEARQLETTLQRQLLRAGIALESSHDSQHRNFSARNALKLDHQVAIAEAFDSSQETTLEGASAGLAAERRRLQCLAAELLEVAERLERHSTEL